MATTNDNGSGDRGWQSRIRFAPGGAFAYVPGEVLVPEELGDAAEAELDQMRTDDEPSPQRDRVIGDRFARFRLIREPLEAVATLRRAGLTAQVNHVLFATCCCPPHPASPGADAYYASPYYGSPYYGSPYYGSPYYGSGGPGGGGHAGGCCGCSGGGWWNDPHFADDKYASASTTPFVGSWMHATGDRRSSARPHEAPVPAQVSGVPDAVAVKVTILDTGYANVFVPTAFDGMMLSASDPEEPDADGDGFLDPMAGHGTFIAGVVERFAPGCDIEVLKVLKPTGEGDEVTIGGKLEQLAARSDEDRPDLVNLSFGAYAPMGMAALAESIRDLRRTGTVVVAAAGNDGTCVPMYPAAFADVVGVGALDHDGRDPLKGDEPAAPFTNYGPWVDACASGVGIVSTFFEGFDGDEQPGDDGNDPDDFSAGWAVWSGTSFAAPRVVAELARRVQGGNTPREAKEHLIDGGVKKRAMLGTVVGIPDDSDPTD